MQSSPDAETLATRICNCCKVLCCCHSRSLTGDPSEEKRGDEKELAVCAGHLSYLLERSLLHGVRTEPSAATTAASEEKDVFSTLTEIASNATAPKGAECLGLAELAKSRANTPQGRVRVFAREIFNHGLYPSFVTLVSASTASLEEHYNSDAFLRNSEFVKRVVTALTAMSASITPPPHFPTGGEEGEEGEGEGNDIDAPEYWNKRPEIVMYDPPAENASQTIVPQLPDDSTTLIAVTPQASPAGDGDNDDDNDDEDSSNNNTNSNQEKKENSNNEEEKKEGKGEKEIEIKPEKEKREPEPEPESEQIPTDLAALEGAACIAQSLICAAGIRERFGAIVGASEVFQGVVVGTTTGLGFLLGVVVGVWAQGAIRTSLAVKRRERLEEHTREAQGLFCAVVQRNIRHRRALELVCYVQNVLADRKLEKKRAEEHAKLVAAHAHKPAASPGQKKKSEGFVSINSFKVDLSRHNLASMIPTKRPVWVPDSFSNSCAICSKQFTFGYRRHHCRNCGNLVCSQCTIFMPLVHLGYDKPARVCIPCRDFLLTTK